MALNLPNMVYSLTPIEETFNELMIKRLREANGFGIIGGGITGFGQLIYFLSSTMHSAKGLLKYIHAVLISQVSDDDFPESTEFLKCSFFETQPQDDRMCIFKASDVKAFWKDILKRPLRIVVRSNKPADRIFLHLQNLFNFEGATLPVPPLLPLTNLGNLLLTSENPDPSHFEPILFAEWSINAEYGQINGYAQFLHLLFNSRHPGGFLETHSRLKIQHFVVESEQLSSRVGIIRFRILLESETDLSECYNYVLSYLAKIASNSSLNALYYQYLHDAPESFNLFVQQKSGMDQLSGRIVDFMGYLEFSEWSKIIAEPHYGLNRGSPDSHDIAHQMTSGSQNMRVAFSYEMKQKLDYMYKKKIEIRHLGDVHSEKMVSKATLPPLNAH